MYHKTSHIHFMGIGGIGMSGIAKILKLNGYKISGCDNNLNQSTIEELRSIGCQINNHNGSICQSESVNYLVYSSAIDKENIEIKNAEQKNIPVIKRATMLAELMRDKYAIAVGGSHGKTTTSSLISQILLDNNIDPTVIIGGRLKTISSNAYFGKSKFMVVEADESDKSIEQLKPTIAIVTNIDLEHLETYKNLEEIKDTFRKFLDQLPFYGLAIICADDPNANLLAQTIKQKVTTYGLNNGDIRATKIEIGDSYSEFEVTKNNLALGKIKLNIAGKHNILNSLASIAASLELNLNFDQIKQSLENFKGVERRFSYHGNYLGAEIFDDYGHHPKEIEATLAVARKRSKNKLRVVFQPHRYTRTASLWHDFIRVLNSSDIDELIITDIFPASEQPIININSQSLVESIAKANKNLTVRYQVASKDFTEIKNHLDSVIQPNDLILFLGAGKVYELAYKLTHKDS